MARTSILLAALFGFSCAGAATSSSVDSPDNLEAESSCGSGNADACAMIGMSQWLAARTKGGNPKVSLGSFMSGCKLNDWFACAMAGSIQGGSRGNATELAKKAYGLALAACEDDKDASACGFLGDWAVNANSSELAKKHYSLACGLVLTADTREQVLSEFVCKQALEFGAAETDLQPIGAGSSLGRAAKRVSGTAQIHVPDADASKMHRLQVKSTSAELVLCLSETGMPRKIYFTQFSPLLAWNQKIFETMRLWRYSPATNAEGIAVPVCTSVAFVYVAG